MLGKGSIPESPEGWKSVRPLGMVMVVTSVAIFAVGIYIRQPACLLFGIFPLVIAAASLRRKTDIWSRWLPYNYTLYDILEKEIPKALMENKIKFTEKEMVGASTPVKKETGRAYARQYLIPDASDNLMVIQSMHMIHSQSGYSYFFKILIRNVSLNNEAIGRQLAGILDGVLHDTAAMTYEKEK